MKLYFRIICSLGLLSPVLEVDRETFQRDVFPFVKQYCIGCHGPEKAKGEFRFDTDISLDFTDSLNVEKWTEVLNQVNGGNMPPEGEPSAGAEQTLAFTKWITAELHKASQARQSTNGRVVMRRLNRAEYKNTIRDLVGIDYTPADDFPEDPESHGFDVTIQVPCNPPGTQENSHF